MAFLSLVFTLFLTLSAKSVPDDGTQRLFQRFTEAFYKIREASLPAVSDQALLQGAIQGMLRAVDQRSSFLEPHTYENLKTHVSGQLVGIGVELLEGKDAFFIERVLPGTPAHGAGILAGDQLLAIDGESLQGYSLEEVGGRLKGNKGQKISLTLQTPGTSPRTLALKKDIITLETVSSTFADGILTIKISSFNSKRTARLVKDILLKHKKDLQGIILDLRDNGGGLFDQALEVSNLFLEEQEITRVQGRAPKDQRIYKAGKGALVKNIPLVVLTNGGTASAAEIVAGALKDHGRATVIGTKTLGKASVQSIFGLENSQGALSLTTHHYHTPLGKNIDQNGITPHIDYIEPQGIEIIALRSLQKKEVPHVL